MNHNTDVLLIEFSNLQNNTMIVSWLYIIIRVIVTPYVFLMI